MDVRVGLLKKAEHWRIDAFELWCWRRLLEFLDCKEIKPVHPKGNQFWVFIGRTDVEAETPIFWPPATNSWVFEKTLMLGNIEGRRRRGQQRVRWLDGITDSTDMSLGKLRSWWWTGRPGVLQSMGSQRVGHDWVTELIWTQLKGFLGSASGKEPGWQCRKC